MASETISVQTKAALELKEAFVQELQSFRSPPAKDCAPIPQFGQPAPRHEKLHFGVDKPTIVVFLRHCGCPFAEKTFRQLTKFSNKHKDSVHCIAISHSSREATEKWVPLAGGEWEVDVVVDEGRDIYSQWGLGLSSYWHAIGPSTLSSAVKLGREEGIWNRTTESGTRWQTSGAFAADAGGIIRWTSVAKSADHIPDFAAAYKAVEPGKTPTGRFVV